MNGVHGPGKYVNIKLPTQQRYVIAGKDTETLEILLAFQRINVDQRQREEQTIVVCDLAKLGQEDQCTRDRKMERAHKQRRRRRKKAQEGGKCLQNTITYATANATLCNVLWRCNLSHLFYTLLLELVWPQ